MKNEVVLKSCYSVLRKTTPLEFDCGALCDGACCKGADDTGMLLFPGEEKLIDPQITVAEDGLGNKIAVCNGNCDRAKRPLACRIYPLFPIIKRNEKGEYIEVDFDVRAVCPLKNGEIKISRRFYKGVRRVGKYLLCNDKIAEFYRNLSAEISDYKELEEIFLK